MDVKRSPERAAPEDEELEEGATPPAAEEGEEQKTAAAEEPETPAEPPAEDEGESDDEATERRARAVGWVPREEWRGDPKKWTPAERYLERMYANAPIYNERLDKMAGELTDTKARLDEVTHKLTETTEVLVDLNERNKTAWDQGYRRARQELFDKRDRAIEDGDKEAVKATEQEIHALDAQHQPPARAEPAQPQRQEPPKFDPAFDAFAKANASWWNKDAELTDLAEVIERGIIRQNPAMPIAERLKHVHTEIRRRRPDKFSNQRREAPSAVNGSGSNNRGGGRKGRSVADLPADAKDALAKLKRTIPGYTDAEYLKTYEWEG